MKTHGTLYLAGPITGLTFDDATDWREGVRQELEPLGVQCLSPLRHKVYFRDTTDLLTATGYDELPLSCPRGLTTRDRWDTQRADVVLVNLLCAERPSIGTMIELGWADSRRIPIVIAMEKTNCHQHAMVREVAGYVLGDLDTALEVVKALLVPEPLATTGY